MTGGFGMATMTYYVALSFKRCEDGGGIFGKRK